MSVELGRALTATKRSGLEVWNGTGSLGVCLGLFLGVMEQKEGGGGQGKESMMRVDARTVDGR